jgi:hypothetical protein
MDYGLILIGGALFIIICTLFWLWLNAENKVRKYKNK